MRSGMARARGIIQFYLPPILNHEWNKSRSKLLSEHRHTHPTYRSTWITADPYAFEPETKYVIMRVFFLKDRICFVRL